MTPTAPSAAAAADDDVEAVGEANFLACLLAAVAAAVVEREARTGTSSTAFEVARAATAARPTVSGEAELAPPPICYGTYIHTYRIRSNITVHTYILTIFGID